MPGTAQPDLLPILKFRLDNVSAAEAGGFAPSTIVNAGNNFTLQTDLGIEGVLGPILSGQSYEVRHHAQRLEDGTLVELAGGVFAVPTPPPAPPASFPAASGPYTTGLNGSGANLETAPGQSTGTWLITTHIHFVAPPVASIVTAFNQIVVMVQS